MERGGRKNHAVSKQIILITGGARSGKSRYAEERAVELGERRLYIATAEAKDPEMAERIAAHRNRRGRAWTTIEEPVEISAALLAHNGKTDCALVDCLTLWLSNLLLRRDAEYAEEKVRRLVETLPLLDLDLVLVTNEVGAGIVPDNPLARQFRDLTGWTNQQLAAVASEVVLTVAGVPMIVKKTDRCR
jgi:adenosylcobinamide kinase/adenosylcobinamide-phosphate guanylyltransferase